ncbi:MAG: aldose epimerase family protein [Propionicimonas sp.]|uniref:aldose epimerase family protein n=1 Tax=Propionicimonas sp. TaxID=1955623 RepID=UPI003D0AC632
MISEDSLIRLDGDAVRLELLPLGATLRRFDVRLADGTWRNIVLGSADLDGYLGANIYLGMTVGRFANRIADATFTLDGVEYPLVANEGANQLHGGPDGFHAREWTVAGQGDDWVEFTLTSPDGDQGYPGTLRVSARYELVPGGAKVTYRATTDAPTVINLTTHPYFNMAGEGSGNTDDHVLTVHASRYTPNRDDGIPTGEIRDVTGSAADFRGGRAFGEARVQGDAEGITRNGGFDHNFVVDGFGLREHCRLSGPDGLTLVVESDQPAIQVYGGEHFDGSQIGTSGRPYDRRPGVALETQHYPDSPNQPAFPSTTLRPGEEYVATTRWLIVGA